MAWSFLNRAAALVLILLASPLLAVLAWLVWRCDGGPAIYAHYRIGAGGRVFPCYKFRSMAVESERLLQELLRTDESARIQWERDRKLSDDPRVTPIGRLLRKYSLDELPQLLNVLRGEMYLVGPRPVVLEELGRYGQVRWHYLSVKPGMTGLWQVSGRNSTTYDRRVELDRHYVEQRSARLDLSILLKTARVVVTGHGAQ